MEQVDFRSAALHVRRVKQGTPSTHPILGDELRALRRLQREQEPKSPYVRSPSAPPGSLAWSNGRGLSETLSGTHTCCGTHAATRWPTKATTRGRCKPISQHTVRYTELSPARFKEFWRC
jgi:hypothetical protein